MMVQTVNEWLCGQSKTHLMFISILDYKYASSEIDSFILKLLFNKFFNKVL